MKIPHTLKSATVVSLLVHLLVGVALGAVLVRRPPIRFGEGPLPAPFVLTLKQPEKPAPEPTPNPVLQMVESPVEADSPPQNTELISEVNSRAADQTESIGDQPGPTPELVDELVTLASRASATPPPSQATAALPPASVEEQQEGTASDPEPETSPVPATPAKRPEPTAEVSHRDLTPSLNSPPKKESQEPAGDKALPKAMSTDRKEAQIGEADPGAAGAAGAAPSNGDLEPFKVAKADTLPLAPEGMQDKTRGKVGDAVLGEGFTSFDAIRDEIAPYLKLIKTNVEKRWNEEIITRYDGHMPTEATVDCAISPEGKVISVVVVGAPKDRLYAALCKRAIERAGPFGAFPFEVPEMYRSKNLEIRWTFSFLR